MKILKRIFDWFGTSWGFFIGMMIVISFPLKWNQEIEATVEDMCKLSAGAELNEIIKKGNELGFRLNIVDSTPQIEVIPTGTRRDPQKIYLNKDLDGFQTGTVIYRRGFRYGVYNCRMEFVNGKLKKSTVDRLKPGADS